jgi:NADH dehydrogenase
MLLSRTCRLRALTASGPIRSFASDSIPRPRPRFVRRTIQLARFAGYFTLSSAFGVLAIGAGIFIHDAFTYTEKHMDRVPVSPLALHPERGGPKDLPVVRVQVDDEEDEENKKLAEKPRLVIVGGGWGVRPTVLTAIQSPC